MSSFSLYMIGFVILIAGLAYGAFLVGIPPTFIGVGVLVLAGFGLISATKRTRTRDISPEGSMGETTTTTTRRDV